MNVDPSLIKIDSKATKPIYKQIQDCIIDGIIAGKISRHQKLPSINQISDKLDLSRDTVVKAYYQLRDKGIIASTHGKGFYIFSTNTKQNLKIFLLFNEMNEYKKVLYNSLMSNFHRNVIVDTFFHNHNPKIFERLILDNIGNYNHFIIIPTFYKYEKKILKTLKQIPPDRLLILDRPMKKLDCAMIYQNFESDIFYGMEKAKEYLMKYKRITGIFTEKTLHPVEATEGMKRFCEKYDFKFRLIDKINSRMLNENEVYFTFQNEDLIKLLSFAKKKKLQPGKDLGVISYNDSQLKEVIRDGISVISTDFKSMGKTAAELILKQKRDQISNPFYFKARNSI